MCEGESVKFDFLPLLMCPNVNKIVVLQCKRKHKVYPSRTGSHILRLDQNAHRDRLYVSKSSGRKESGGGGSTYFKFQGFDFEKKVFKLYQLILGQESTMIPWSCPQPWEQHSNLCIFMLGCMSLQL